MAGRKPTVLRWMGEIPAGFELREVQVALAHTRTQVRGMVLTTPEGEHAFGVEGFQGQLRLDPALSSPHEPLSVQLVITYSGDTPRPVGVTVNRDKSINLPPWYPQELAGDKDVSPELAARLWALEVSRRALPVHASTSAEMALAVPSEADAFAQRLLAIQRDSLIRRSFYDYDFATNPILNPQLWSQLMADLNFTLGDRVTDYARFGQRCRWPRFGPLQGGMLASLTTVSAAFRSTFESLIAAEPSGDPTVDLFEWAFEHFVTGALATRHNELGWQEVLLTHGSPNSTYFLRFAMLAVVCLEAGVDVDFWKLHLRTLVRTTHIFIESAAPLKEPPYPGLEPEFLFFADRYFPRERRKILRQEYANEVGAGKPWNEEFDALRARLASILGLAIATGIGGAGATEEVITPDLVAKLLPYGVGVPITHTCGV